MSGLDQDKWVASYLKSRGKEAKLIAGFKQTEAAFRQESKNQDSQGVIPMGELHDSPINAYQEAYSKLRFASISYGLENGFKKA